MTILGKKEYKFIANYRNGGRRVFFVHLDPKAKIKEANDKAIILSRNFCFAKDEPYDEPDDELIELHRADKKGSFLISDGNIRIAARVIKI